MQKSDLWRQTSGKGDIGDIKTFTQTYATAATTVPAQTAGNGTGADGTTPAGAEYTKTNDDVLANRKLINAIIDALQEAGIAL